MVVSNTGGRSLITYIHLRRELYITFNVAIHHQRVPGLSDSIKLPSEFQCDL